MKILLTGFEPFAGETTNAALKTIQALPKELFGHEIITAILPTTFYQSTTKVVDLMHDVMPDIIIAIGQAGGRCDVTPERIAINVDDARIPDNIGQQPLNFPIVVDGPSAYFSTLPVYAMVHKIKQSGIPASLSNTAGTFVCNHVMYSILHTIATTTKFNSIRAGFIHVPLLPEQTNNKVSLSLNQLTTAIIASIQACLENTTDIEIPLGTFD